MESVSVNYCGINFSMLVSDCIIKNFKTFIFGLMSIVKIYYK